jgi:hypothetical protein
MKDVLSKTWRWLFISLQGRLVAALLTTILFAFIFPLRNLFTDAQFASLLIVEFALSLSFYTAVKYIATHQPNRSRK